MKTKSSTVIKALPTFRILLLLILIIPLGSTACNSGKPLSTPPTALESTFMALEQTELMVADSEELVSVVFRINESLRLQETPNNIKRLNTYNEKHTENYTNPVFTAPRQVVTL